MPIKPENRRRYPASWKQIRARIMERADNRCECSGQCGSTHAGRDRCNVIHGKTVRRLLDAPHDWVPESCRPLDGLSGPIRVVLTIAHLDHTPENCADENLLAMCQRCHLLYDKDHHVRTARRTRFERKADRELFA